VLHLDHATEVKLNFAIASIPYDARDFNRSLGHRGQHSVQETELEWRASDLGETA
jgi:hypothetical protein